ncbi:ABC transporter permease [Mycetocola spongiae]|uniref:ABC transporter permease n=1 Tax=Mycetocola spongiae TaxID=2859226 RepID=UPI001CF38061|nr:ABC transporter permease [Mycetocola spongiae]UCR88458.1 ABC transporter permease [Mycetocola spongiae]
MTVYLLAMRNLRLFFRDRTQVFFSLLSALILIALYALFLGNLQVLNLREAVPGASDEQISAFVNSWVFAGIIMITSLTTGLAAIGIFVEDRSTGRFRDFLVSPIRRSHLILGYLIASFVVALVMTIFVAIVGQVYLAIRGEPLMNAVQALTLLGYIALSAAAFSALSSFIVTFIRSNGAFSALSTIVGTVVGFLAGAYIPAGTLPSGVVNVMNALPFAQSAALMRQPLTANALEDLADGHSEAITELSEFYGISLSVGDFDLNNGMILGIMAGIFVVFVLCGSWRIGRSIR